MPLSSPWLSSNWFQPTWICLSVWFDASRSLHAPGSVKLLHFWLEIARHSDRAVAVGAARQCSSRFLGTDRRPTEQHIARQHNWHRVLLPGTDIRAPSGTPAVLL